MMHTLVQFAHGAHCWSPLVQIDYVLLVWKAIIRNNSSLYGTMLDFKREEIFFYLFNMLISNYVMVTTFQSAFPLFMHSA